LTPHRLSRSSSKQSIHRALYEFYAQGSTYEELHEANRKMEPLWRRYVADTSFRFLVTSSQHKIPQSRQRDVIESFAYMGFLGKIDMKNPEIILTCFEECTCISSLYRLSRVELILVNRRRSPRNDTRKARRRRRFQAGVLWQVGRSTICLGCPNILTLSQTARRRLSPPIDCKIRC
jgi:hypothetical protein